MLFFQYSLFYSYGLSVGLDLDWAKTKKKKNLTHSFFFIPFVLASSPFCQSVRASLWLWADCLYFCTVCTGLKKKKIKPHTMAAPASSFVEAPAACILLLLLQMQMQQNPLNLLFSLRLQSGRLSMPPLPCLLFLFLFILMEGASLCVF